MISFKQYLNESEENEYHRQFHEGLLQMASKHKAYAKGAADYYHMAKDNPEGLVAYYDKHVLPLLKDKPEPFSKGWGEAQDAVRKQWYDKNSLKEQHVGDEEAVFHHKLKQHYPHGVDVYHESPGHVADSIRKHSLVGDYGIFGAVGQPSGFVTAKQKTITHFVVPHTHSKHLGPDMMYDADNPHADLLSKHPDLKGAYVCYHDEEIPKHWIKGIKEV